MPKAKLSLNMTQNPVQDYYSHWDEYIGSEFGFISHRMYDGVDTVSRHWDNVRNETRQISEIILRGVFVTMENKKSWLDKLGDEFKI